MGGRKGGGSRTLAGLGQTWEVDIWPHPKPGQAVSSDLYPLFSGRRSEEPIKEAGASPVVKERSLPATLPADAQR